jgi:hypothetical protein
MDGDGTGKGLEAMKRTVLGILFCGLLSAQRTETPKWNYTPRHTIESETGKETQGLEFGFFRPIGNEADISVIARTDGRETRAHATIRIKDPDDGTSGHALFPMPVGNLETFKVLHIEARIGSYFSTEDNPLVATDYELKQK